LGWHEQIIPYKRFIEQKIIKDKKVCKDIKNRIEELNTDLVLQETKIDVVLKEIKTFAIKIDSNSTSKFRQLLNDLQHYKNEYNCIKTQLKTFNAYQVSH